MRRKFLNLQWITLIGISFLIPLYVKKLTNLTLLKPAGEGDLLTSYASTNSYLKCGLGDIHFGFPYGMYQVLRPSSDWLFSIPANAINCLSGNPFLGLNLIWLLSFPFTFLMSFWLQRLLGIRFWINFAASMVITFMPYHWDRLGHIYLATTFSLLIGVILSIYCFEHSLLEGNESKIAMLPKWLLAFMALAVAWMGVYYAIFTVFLIAVALVFQFSISRSFRILLSSLWIPCLIILGLLLSNFITYFVARGSYENLVINTRNSSESVIYSGNLVRLLLPNPSGGFPLPDEISKHLDNLYLLTNQINFPVAGESGTFQNLATSLMVLLLVALMPFGTNFDSNVDLHRFKLLSIQSLILTLFFVPWGFNIIFAEFISPQIRAWGRLEPLLIILLLILASIRINRLIIQRSDKHVIEKVTAMALVFILIVDVGPLITSMTSQKIINAKTEFTEAELFAEMTNRQIPERCGILQLPYVSWPEAGTIFGLPSDGHFMVGLANAGKNWSFGGFRQSPSDLFSQSIGSEISKEKILELRKNGFCGIQVDSRGFESESTFDRYRSQLDQQIGRGSLVSSNGLWYLWDIR